jgi:hypothetical protein
VTNSLPISTDTPPPLDQKDYPNIRFWTAKAFETHCNNISGETDGLATQEKRRGRRRRDEDNEDRYPYLETADGSPVPWEAIVTTGHKARRVWQSLRNIGQAPASWGRASESAYTYFNSEILSIPELKFFRYCEGNWKIMRWATKAYSSWAHNHLHTKEVRVNKRKRQLLDDPFLLQIGNDTNEGDVIVQSPEPSLDESASTSVATHAPRALTLAPTEVSSHRIPRLSTENHQTLATYGDSCGPPAC